MGEPLDTVHVNVEYYDGQEEGDVGHPYYVASCVEIAAVTDGRTLDELMANIQEMVDFFLEDPETAAASNLVQNPRIVVTIELPSHAEAA
jgi:predicted RNase H-like HicB family nuclease